MGYRGSEPGSLASLLSGAGVFWGCGTIVSLAPRRRQGRKRQGGRSSACTGQSLVAVPELQINWMLIL